MKRSSCVAGLALAILACQQRGAPVESQAPEESGPPAEGSSVHVGRDVGTTVAFAPQETSVAVRPPGIPVQAKPEPPALSAVTGVSFEPAQPVPLSSLNYVHCELRVVGLGGPHSIVVEFVAPNGFLYERREKQVDESPFVAQTLRFDLMVAGTMIDQSVMTGDWNVRYFLDGQPLAASPFELKP